MPQTALIFKGYNLEMVYRPLDEENKIHQLNIRTKDTQQEVNLGDQQIEDLSKALKYINKLQSEKVEQDVKPV